MSTDKNAPSSDTTPSDHTPSDQPSVADQSVLSDEALEEVAGGFNGAPLKPVWRPKPAQPPIIRTFE